MIPPRLVLAALACIMVVPASARAQRMEPWDAPAGPARVDLSAAAGFLISTDWSDTVLFGSASPATGSLQQILVRDLVVDPGPVYDGTVTYWRGRYGFRAHVGYAQSCLAVGRNCGDVESLTAVGTADVNTYAYDVGGAIGLLDYAPGRWAWPYVFAGFGGITYDLDRTVGPPLTFIESPPLGDGPVVGRSPRSVLISVEELGLETQLAYHVGVGTDFRIPLGPTGLGVRFELSDHIHDSPLDLEVTAIDALLGPESTRLEFDLVHNLRASVGVVLLFGR